MQLQIREYHRKHPAARVVDADEEFEALLKEEPQIEFSGEVGFCPFSINDAYWVKHFHAIVAGFCFYLLSYLFSLSQLILTW